VWQKWRVVGKRFYVSDRIIEKATGTSASLCEEGEESEREESDLFKYQVFDIRFPVDNGEEAPDPSMRELVMGRV
jgi:hypothetical protein